jgi:membrane dipeptidase
MPADAKGELERPYQLLFRELGPSSGLRIPGCRRPGPGLRTWLALEDARELAAAPTRASLWVARGVRLFGLVGQRDNELGASAASSSPTIGLSARGREAVHAIHAAGGVVDVSNASERTTADVLAEARAVGAPVVASHANARALVDDPRNLSDASLRAIAASHGVIGITLHRRLLARGRDAELDDVVRHVRYVARVAGIDHVALGSGFESGARPPRELMNATRYPRLVRALVASGLDREQVKKVMAQNALRVLCPAQSLKHPPAR